MKMIKAANIIAAVLTIGSFTGCTKSVEKPATKSVDTSEIVKSALRVAEGVAETAKKVVEENTK